MKYLSHKDSVMLFPLCYASYRCYGNSITITTVLTHVSSYVNKSVRLQIVFVSPKLKKKKKKTGKKLP